MYRVSILEAPDLAEGHSCQQTLRLEGKSRTRNKFSPSVGGSVIILIRKYPMKHEEAGASRFSKMPESARGCLEDMHVVCVAVSAVVITLITSICFFLRGTRKNTQS